MLLFIGSWYVRTNSWFTKISCAIHFVFTYKRVFYASYYDFPFCDDSVTFFLITEDYNLSSILNLILKILKMKWVEQTIKERDRITLDYTILWFPTVHLNFNHFLFFFFLVLLGGRDFHKARIILRHQR